MLKHILDNMKNGVDSEKLFLYGTHDISIENTLRAMGFVDELFKLDLGVTLVYELRTSAGRQSREVRVSIEDELLISFACLFAFFLSFVC